MPIGPVMLSRLAVNDPCQVETLMDAVIAVVVETPTINKTIAQQEKDALSTTPLVLKARDVLVLSWLS